MLVYRYKLVDLVSLDLSSQYCHPEDDHLSHWQIAVWYASNYAILHDNSVSFISYRLYYKIVYFLNITLNIIKCKRSAVRDNTYCCSNTDRCKLMIASLARQYDIHTRTACPYLSTHEQHVYVTPYLLAVLYPQ